jgi:hypothetical protein
MAAKFAELKNPADREPKQALGALPGHALKNKLE